MFHHRQYWYPYAPEEVDRNLDGDDIFSSKYSLGQQYLKLTFF